MLTCLPLALNCIILEHAMTSCCVLQFSPNIEHGYQSIPNVSHAMANTVECPRESLEETLLDFYWKHQTGVFCLTDEKDVGANFNIKYFFRKVTPGLNKEVRRHVLLEDISEDCKDKVEVTNEETFDSTP